MNQGRPTVAHAAVRIMRDHAECYAQALEATLAQMGRPSPELEITTRELRATASARAPDLDLELVVRAPGLDQPTLNRAMRRTAPDCLVGGSHADSSHPCLLENPRPLPTDGLTVVAPLPLRQDQTVPGSLKARHEDTIESPLIPRDSTVEAPRSSTASLEAAESAPLAASSAEATVAAPRAAQRYSASELLKLAGIVLAIFLGLRSVIQTFRVDGPSMDPTFESGQALIVNRVAYWYVNGTPFEGLLPVRPQGSTDFVFGGPERGDVVVFRPPGDSYFEADLIKRVIGLPGESVSIQAGEVTVNGSTLVEPYVRFPAEYTFPGEGLALRIPPDSYFVLGDNRPESADSHLGWLVTAEKLVGEAWLTYWPPRRWGLIPRGEVGVAP